MEDFVVRHAFGEEKNVGIIRMVTNYLHENHA
jgi:hypothetical protein